ncbi:MAG: hypothetical protein ACE5LC_03655 [Candidatus Aminicenantales bacterium]
MKKIIVLFLFVFFLSASGGATDLKGYLSFDYSSNSNQSEKIPAAFKNVGVGLEIAGNLGRGFSYRAELRLWETEVRIEQALVSFSLSEKISVSAGLFLVPFGSYNRWSRPHETLLVDLPLHVGEIFPSSWRDIGLVVEGDFGFFFFQTYLGNGLAEAADLGSAQQFEDNNRNKARGGRVGFLLQENFSASFSYYRGKYDEEAQRKLVLRGTDIRWEPGVFQFRYEYTRAELENPDPFAAGKATAHFFQVSFLIWNLRPVASYQELEYEDPFHGPGYSLPLLPSGMSEKRKRWTGGVVYFPHPNLLIKLEYDFDHDVLLALKNNVFKVQVALSF